MKNQQNYYAHQRGEIKESAVKALVTDPLFRHKIEKNRKGKGSYRRHEKHRNAAYAKGETPFKSIFESLFKWGFDLLNDWRYCFVPPKTALYLLIPFSTSASNSTFPTTSFKFSPANWV